MTESVTIIEYSEKPMVGAILAIVGGFLDVYTYLTRGGVFANAQTGNLACLGIAIASFDFASALHYIIPIIAFALGVLLVQFINRFFLKIKKLNSRQAILIVELIILATTAFIPIGNLDMIVNVAISFVCALQCESFRKVQGNTLATTMCTGNLRIAMEMMFGYITEKKPSSLKKSLQYLTIIAFFIAGAILGGICVKEWNKTATLVPTLFLLIAFILVGTSKNKSGKIR